VPHVKNCVSYQKAPEPGLVSFAFVLTIFIRYDTIGEFNVDWKAEYSALSSTRSQKKKLKQPTPVPL